MSVKVIENEAHFQQELELAGTNLVVADFMAAPCLPCQFIAPYFDILPIKYPKAIFLKVDVVKCKETATNQGIYAMPTFLFYHNRSKIDKLQGSNLDGLEEKIQNYLNSGSGSESTEEYGHRVMDLNILLVHQFCVCLNEDDEFNLSNAFDPLDGYLESDYGGQLLISVFFNQLVKIYSIRMNAPTDLGPKDIKVFINQAKTLDFEKAESSDATQAFSLQPSDLEPGSSIKLNFAEFQNVQNLQIYVRNNQCGGDVTRIDHLSFIGSPISPIKVHTGKKHN